MIDRLRKRFIAAAMAAVTVVIVLVCAGIDVAGLVACTDRADEVLDVIAANGGRVPGGPHGPLGPEEAFTTRYFVLTVGPEGAVASSDLSHVAAVTSDEMGSFVTFAASARPGYGWHGGYRYLLEEDGGSGLRTAVFLDRGAQLASVRGTAVASAVVGVAADVAFYGIVRLLSSRAVDPLVQSAKRQQRFITDASHELKTPLTVIVTSLRVLQMEVGENRWIEKAERQAVSMGELIDDLIVLSRLEGDDEGLWEETDLSALVREAVEGFADVAAVRGHQIRASVEPGVEVEGESRSIAKLLTLLLDNAVKYAEEGSHIDLSLTRDRKGARLTVSNVARSLDQEDLERLFDRFYRPDEARSRETGGHGIGLAQARSIVEAHGGTIEASQRTDDEGATVFSIAVHLPA